MDNKISQKDFYKNLDGEVERLVNWLDRTESPSGACEALIFELIIRTNESYYTQVGILKEVLFQFQKISNEIMEKGVEDGEDN